VCEHPECVEEKRIQTKKYKGLFINGYSFILMEFAIATTSHRITDLCYQDAKIKEKIIMQ